MKKIFTRYLCYVMVFAFFAVILLNYVLQSDNAKTRMRENSKLKLQQIEQTLHSNDAELKGMTSSLGEDYLTRAKAFAYIIEQNPEVINSKEELNRIKLLLNVDELHVIDENGFLCAGTIPEYIGMDFRTTKQTAEFLKILEDQSFTLVQEIQPNGAEQKVFQYVGVARQDKPGIVQVGLEPHRLLEAKKRNELSYIFSRVTLEAKSSIFAVDADSLKILAHTDRTLVGKNIVDLGVGYDFLEKYKNGGFYGAGSNKQYCIMEKYENMILGVSQLETALYAERGEQMLLAVTFLIITFILVTFVIDNFLQRQIVDGIYRIMGGISKITKGNLETIVKVENNPEFAELSRGINQMVNSILDATVKVSRIIDLADVPIGVFEFHDEMDRVMATERLRQILLLTEGETEELYQDKAQFIKKLNDLKRNQEEEEIYKICEHPEKWVKIHMMSDDTGTFGVVTDVSIEMKEKRKILCERDSDALTGLFNLNKFQQIVQKMLECPQQLQHSAIVMLDLDHFKEINDCYGHDWGDAYLKFTAHFLSQFDDVHTITARRSGDEFCLFLYGSETKEQILEMMTEFYENVTRNKIVFPDKSEKALQISSGLAWYGEGLEDYMHLMRAADMALYEAKNSGKGTFRVYSGHIDRSCI